MQNKLHWQPQFYDMNQIVVKMNRYTPNRFIKIKQKRSIPLGIFCNFILDFVIISNLEHAIKIYFKLSNEK